MSLLVRSVMAILMAATFLPAAARADAPWTPPAALPGVGANAGVQVAMTASGLSAVVGQNGGSTWLAESALVTPVGPDGSFGTASAGLMYGPRVAGYGGTGYAVVGTGPLDAQWRASIVVGLGLVDRGLGPLGTLPGTKGQSPLHLAANAHGDVAFVAGAPHGPLTVWRLLAGGHGFTRILDVAVHERDRPAAIAVGAQGDVLVAWEDSGRLLARDLPRHGAAGPTMRVGPAATTPAIRTDIHAAIDSTGRRLIAWSSQAVEQRAYAIPATTRFATAPAHHRFSGAARTLTTTPSPYETGRPEGPAVRLVLDGPARAFLAWTAYDRAGRTYDVQAAEVAGGHVGTPHAVSPAGIDAMLADAATGGPDAGAATGGPDAAIGAPGAATVLWRAGPNGQHPDVRQQLMASVRAAGAAAFGGPEAIGAPGTETSGETVVIDPTTGRSLAFFPTGTGIVVSTRPAG